MKSGGGGHYGQINMRGKKAISLSCGCCNAIDLRDKERAKEAHREMSEARRDQLE